MFNTTLQAPQTMNDLLSGVYEQIQVDSVNKRFRRMYENDRIAFAYDCMGALGRNLTKYQEFILGLYDEGYARVAVRAPHGTGKSFLASVLVHHSILTADGDAKTPTTASVWRQLEKYLWTEIWKHSKYIDWTRIGRDRYIEGKELMQLSIKLPNAIEAFAVASNDHQSIEGAHAHKLFYIFDEAKAIPPATWDAAEGAFSNATNTKYITPQQKAKDIKTLTYNYSEYANKLLKNKNVNYDTTPTFIDDIDVEINAGNNLSAIKAQENKLLNVYEARALAISTPGIASGRFYDIHARKPGFENWYPVHVTLEDAIRSGRISKEWAEMSRKMWGEDSQVYKNRVLGEFADETGESLIPNSHVVKAFDRWLEWKKAGSPLVGKMYDDEKVVGLDVARFGADNSVFAFRSGNIVERILAFSKLSTVSLAHKAKDLCRNYRVNVEVDGIGAGVYDNMRDLSMENAYPITVSASTLYTDSSSLMSFYDVRSAMWWNMKEMLNPNNGYDIALPPIEELRVELITPMWENLKDNVIKVENKRSIMSRIGRSPDFATAVCLSFWSGKRGGGVVF